MLCRAAALCALITAPALAQTAGITLETIPTTFQFDRNNNFAWRFTPTRDIDVDALAYFDATSLAGGSGAGLAQSHPVGIFRISDQGLVASAMVPAGAAAPLAANFRWVRLAAPVRLTAGTTYEADGFCLSAGPDPAAAATSWSFPPEILFANSPAPSSANLTGGTSVYITSAGHGGGVQPPSGLAYAGVATSGILPTFVANFSFVQAGVCRADFNGDGDIGTDADIEAFFACLAGTCCATCGSPDFNGDGDIGTDADIESFFRVLAGGSC